MKAFFKRYADIIYILLLLSVPAIVSSDILFDDSSKQAGMLSHSPTAASAWGDFNSDGWPDLWVSNHHGLLPSLYLNQKNGTFINVADNMLSDDLRLDFHGAAWADFDNDGDQDLIVITGGGAGRGVSPNIFLVNENGKLTNKAREFGLDYPLGRGRTPIWLDVNNDGKLDVLLMNKPRSEAPSVIFLQTDSGFVNSNKAFHFLASPSSKPESFFDRMKQLIGIDAEKPRSISVSNGFAQLADLSGNNQSELVVYMQSSRFYSLDRTGFQEITDSIKLPSVSSVQDIAVEDFNGDGHVDMYLVRSRPYALDFIQTSAVRLQGKMQNREKFKSISFRTDGDVTFQLNRPWMDLSDPARKIKPKLFVGSNQIEFTDESFTILSRDAALRKAAPLMKGKSDSISIERNDKSKVWTLKSSVKLINFIITSTKPVDLLKTQGFKPSKGSLKDALLFGNKGEFISQKTHVTEQTNACTSVVAGDFDNDMDIDLYLVCVAPTENSPNLLYENDGTGNFERVAKAGGAEGSKQGRGNQVVMADFDRDGFLDLFVTNGYGAPPFAEKGPYQLFNNRGNENHWLQIDLKGVTSNRDGVGAKIILNTKDKTQVRLQGGGMHSFSQNYARIHFGLGPHAIVDKLTIYWPSGLIQNLTNVKSDQVITIEEK